MKLFRKRKPVIDISDLGFDEALTRFIQANPKELEDHHSRVVDRAEEIERDATEHFKDIKSGGRRAKRPFRP